MSGTVEPIVGREIGFKLRRGVRAANHRTAVGVGFPDRMPRLYEGQEQTAQGGQHGQASDESAGTRFHCRPRRWPCQSRDSARCSVSVLTDARDSDRGDDQTIS
jgi:hypothetical protein